MVNLAVREVAATQVHKIFTICNQDETDGLDSGTKIGDECKRLSLCLTYLTNVDRADTECLMDKAGSFFVHLNMI